MLRQGSRKNGKSARTQKSVRDKQSRPHVISLRVNDQEKQLLEQLSQRRYKNVSAVVREALEHWLAR